MRISGLIFLPLLLAACSQQDEPAEAEAPAPEASFSPSTAAPEAAATIPVAYRGVWDWTGGSCDVASDMRMEIAANAITFYESLGTVLAVREEAGGIAIDLAMEGEGEQWQQTTRLTLIADGPLLQSDNEDPQTGGPLRYQQCPVETAQ